MYTTTRVPTAPGNTLKTWKNNGNFSSHGNIMEFENYEKYHGKMGGNLEK